MAMTVTFKFVVIFLIFHCIKLSFSILQFIYFFELNSLELEPFVKANFQELNFFLHLLMIVEVTLIEIKLLTTENAEIEFF